MKQYIPFIALSVAFIALPSFGPAAHTAPPTAPSAKPLAHLSEVPFSQVTISDRFWAPRQETNRRVSLGHSLDMLAKAGNIEDFDLAAKGAREGYKGPVFMDSDLYKALEGVAYSLHTHPDPELEKRFDDIVARIAAAQLPDGYLNTWYQVNAPDKRFTNLRDHHELYCAGHLFEAAAAHFQATGKRTLLAIATKYADYLCTVFGTGPGKRMGYCGHPEIELALVKLWRVTGEQKYFDLARFFIDTRGGKFFATEHGTPLEKYDGEYWQDNAPIREHTRIVGHAVRAAYLMSGVVDVAGETGDEGLLAMVNRVWRNTAERNTYITGGIGPSAHNEGFTHDYDLPNLTAYQETCASVAMAMWNHRLNLLSGDAKYADMVETALYNGVLAGVSLDGKRFFYVNPLASRGDHHRRDWYGCACCPPNVTRTLASLGGYAYAASPDGLWVNLYVQGSARSKVAGGDLAIDVTTDYPWEGRVGLTIREAPAAEFALNLRIPGWCDGESVSINGAAIANPIVERGYFRVRREWKSGDRVELNLPMPVRRVEASPLVEADRGLLAVARGPLIYCMEGCDQRGAVSTIALGARAELTSRFEPKLFGGVTVLEGEGIAAAETEWSGGLYRTAAAPKPTPVKFVPYYAWDNREPGEMEVWIPTTPPSPLVVGPEGRARVSMSFTSWNCQPNGINDGAEPASSSEQPAQCCHWWNHKGGPSGGAGGGASGGVAAEWVQYDWPAPITAAACNVYWFDDTGRGECRVPASWRLLYKDGAEWRPVQAAGAYEVKKDRWCEVRFAPVTTSALRLEVQLQDGWSSGVHEWKVELAGGEP